MTIKHNYIAYFLGCVVDGMSIIFHNLLVNLVQNAMTTTCLCFFCIIIIQALAIGEYKQCLLFDTLDTLQCTRYRVQ